MKNLYNSRGSHIASIDNSNQVFNIFGRHIGRLDTFRNIVISPYGSYVGDIVNGDRLLKKIGSPFTNANLGGFGDYGNKGIGYAGNKNANVYPGYEDVNI